MSNRLGFATSLYLQQHADNPVDWWEWSPEAFAEAKRRDVPILLSVGYAACHWCHVMAHESFEDEATAAYLNAHYVSIKVDREERPDVDAVYMQATTALTGQGGWPMTCVLDHEGRPFFAGTYFPDQPRHGQPSFTQVLQAISDAWANRRTEIAESAESIAAHLRRGLDTATSGRHSTSEEVSHETANVDLDQAVRSLANQFDPMAGGFGSAPKFPPTMVLEFLRRYAVRLGGDSETGRQASHMLARTLHAMAGSGMYDQLGGGFARYSVDRGWVVPHFEKMLYDNAQLLSLYANTGQLRIAEQTADFLLRELRTEQGGFASALDADSDDGTGRHVEGAFYAWTPDQLTEALGVERGRWAADLFSVTDAGTFEHGTSTLQLRHMPSEPHELARLAEVRARLFDVRSLRIPPTRDDKVVAAWNGLAISGLVDVWFAMGDDKYLEAAINAATLLREVHTIGGRLRRASRDGVSGAPEGVLEDYACVAAGYLALLCATADAQWLVAARDLLDAALDHFRAEDGGFYDTADDAESLITRPRESGDNASPCGQSAMVNALLTFSAITGESRYRLTADEALAALATMAAQAPRFAGWTLVAAERMRTECEVAVVGPASPERDELVAAARKLPGSVVVVSDGPNDAIPLLRGRGPVDGAPAAYVCRGMVCERPVTAVADLRAV